MTDFQYLGHFEKQFINEIEALNKIQPSNIMKTYGF